MPCCRPLHGGIKHDILLTFLANDSHACSALIVSAALQCLPAWYLDWQDVSLPVCFPVAPANKMRWQLTCWQVITHMGPSHLSQ